MKQKFIMFVLICSLVQPAIYAIAAEQPERSKGISVYFNPESVVEQAKAEHKAEHIQRFMVTNAERTSVMAWDSTAQGLVEQIKYQPMELQKNGVWLVFTDPVSYTGEDMREKGELERLTKGNGIPLFECRASDLPDGWKRLH